MEFPTNINGKLGILFNSQGWGGDNFQFKASIDNSQQNITDCITYHNPETIQVWRKVEVDYAIMADRGDNYPCPKQREHKGNHDISGGFEFTSIGVFDDCYIELKWVNVFSDTAYKTMLRQYGGSLPNYPSVNQYGNDFTPFDKRKDAMLIVGNDHIIHECLSDFASDPYENIGYTPPAVIPEPDFFSFVSVGHIDDRYRQRRRFEYIIDYEDVSETYYVPGFDFRYAVVSSHVAAHELAHNLHNGAGFSLDNWVNSVEPPGYGLMDYNDRRWYLHHRVILELREKLTYLDMNAY